MEVKKLFGEKVKKYRLKQGITQEKFADLANIDRTYVPSIEKGERNVSIEVAVRIAKALKVEIGNLI